MSEERKPFDSKAFLAFGVLLALVMLLPVYWEWIGYETKPKPSTITSDTSKTITTAPLTPEPVNKSDSIDYHATSDSTRDGFVAPIDWSNQLVSVSTPQFDATFTTLGGRLVHYSLKQFSYTDAPRRGQPIVLIDSADVRDGTGPRFRFANDRFLLDRVPFTVDQPSLTLTKSDSGSIHLVSQTAGGSTWTLTYSFHGDRYGFDTRLQIPEPWKDGVERELHYGWESGLWPTEPDVEDDNGKFAAVALMGEKDLETVDGVEAERPVTTFSGETKWAAVRTKYFAGITIPRSHAGEGFRVEATTRPFTYGGQQSSIKKISASVRTPLRPGEPVDQVFTMYVGPIDYDLLKSYGVGLEEMVDLGWRWIVRPFALLLLWLFQLLHAIFANYGIVIIVFALLIKAIFHPLTKKQILSMRKMQLMQPKMEKLKERFKSDPQRMNVEMMKMYKEAGINPLSGCLPLLPQMPIFYALFQVFQTTIELRGASFMGWITDLSQKDPYYILPIIMTVSMFVQQKISSTDPKQKMLMYILPLVFGFMFRNFPAGLTLYWTMFNIFSIVEQMWLIGRPEELDVAVATGEVGSGKVVSSKTT